MPETYLDLIAAAQAHLTAARAQITAEIVDYPTPISGCDAQFNHLLAERNRLGDTLATLHRPVFVATPRTLCPQDGVESR